MKKEEYIKWRKKTQKWEKEGHKVVKQLFRNEELNGGYWLAGYSQAISDFINKYHKIIT